MMRLRVIAGIALGLLLVVSIVVSFRQPAPVEKGIKSINSDVETKIKFVNKSKQTIKVYWLDYEGERKLGETVKDGDSYELGKSYLTHPWLITDEKDNGWYVYFPDAQPRTVDPLSFPSRSIPSATCFRLRFLLGTCGQISAFVANSVNRFNSATAS